MTQVWILLVAVFLGCCLGCFSTLWASSNAFLTTPISVAVISAESRADYETRIAPLMKEQMKTCSSCSIQNLTPYTKDGQFSLATLPAQIEAARSSSSFLFLNWNAKSTAETKPVVEVLKKIVQSGMVVVASAGVARGSEPTLPLSRTVVGEVHGIVIIGELGEKERLFSQSYFGPEMLTAVKPPREFIGQGFAPLFFASKLAAQWNKKTGADWLTHFQSTKAKVRRIWPGLDDFFGR